MFEISRVQAQIRYANNLTDDEQRYEEAIAYYKRAIDSKYAQIGVKACYTLGRCFLFAGKLKHAVEWYRVAKRRGGCMFWRRNCKTRLKRKGKYCHVCGTREGNLSKCAGCNLLCGAIYYCQKYCGQECQHGDWSTRSSVKQ